MSAVSSSAVLLVGEGHREARSVMDHPVMSGWDSHANWYTWTQDFEPYWHQNSSVYPYPRPSSQYGGSCQEKRAATETESEPSCNEGTDLDKAERDKNEVSLQGSIHRRIEVNH